MEQVKETLENKISFWDRAKYASIPAALTVGSCFIPEIKQKYNSLPEEKKDTYKTVALAGTTILGAVLTVASGYGWFKNYKKETVEEAVVVR